MNYVTLNNGETLAYREIGNGNKTIIMVHGNICSGDHFMDFIPYLNEEYKIFIPDMRGFGDSSYINKIEDISDFSGDLEAFTKGLGLESFALLGWSAGGCICMDYVMRYPDKALALILIESVGIHGCPMLDANGKPFASAKEISNEPTQVKPALLGIAKQDITFMKNLWDNAIYLHGKPTPERATALAISSLKQRNLADVYWALSRFHLTQNSIKIPILLTWGEDDGIVSKQEVEITANFLKAEELLILKKCGHSPFLDCPVFLTKKINDFLHTRVN